MHSRKLSVGLVALGVGFVGFGPALAQRDPGFKADESAAATDARDTTSGNKAYKYDLQKVAADNAQLKRDQDAARSLTGEAKLAALKSAQSKIAVDEARLRTDQDQANKTERATRAASEAGSREARVIRNDKD